MQTEKPLSKEEIISEYLSEIIEKVGRKRGFYGTKRLPNEEQAEEVDGAGGDTS